MAGVCEFLRFCQEANGWRVLIDCCSVRRPKDGVCELLLFYQEARGQWLVCVS